jgi:hypothetical protein
MRHILMLAAALLPAPLAAQKQEPPAAAESTAPTCADLRAAARREHDDRERARIAAHDDGVRNAFFFDCPLAEEGEDWGISDFQLQQAQSQPTQGENSFGFGEDPFAPQDPRPNRDATVAERCTGNLLDHTCELRSSTSAGRNGEVRSERRCRQDGLTRSCESSGTVSFGNSPDGRNAAREALEGMLDDD